MAFNLEKAREEGYTDAEIASFLSQDSKFDYKGALQEGYTEQEIIDYLMTKPKTGEEAAKQASLYETTSEFLLSPQQPEEFSYGRVAASTAIGGGLGLPFGPVGAVGGATAGLVGGIAGELSRMAGSSRLTTFAAEFAGGFLPSMVKKLGSQVINEKLFGSTPILETVGRILKPQRFQDRVKLRAKRKLFGDAHVGSASTMNQEATQLILRDKHKLVGESNLTVSNILRKNLLTQLDEKASETISKTILKEGKEVIEQVPNVFYHSDEFKNLLDDLDALVQRGKASKSEIGKIKKVLANQFNTNPKVKDMAVTDIINFIQNRGLKQGKKSIDGKVENVMEISVDTQKALRENFNAWMEKNLDDVSYNMLKEAERLEFGAAAADSIPTLVLSKFKKGTEEVENAIKNIKNFEGGDVMLAKAVQQHFRDFGTKIDVPVSGGKVEQIGGNLNADDLMAEFFRLRPMLEDSGVMSRDALLDMTKKLQSIPKTISQEKRRELIAETVEKGLVGVVAGSAPSEGEKATGYSLPSL